MPGEGVRWKARISRSEHKYCRVEVVDAGPEADPIALVPDPKHATAIAALPEVAAALRETRRLLGRCTCMAKAVACDQADAAIENMEGRDATL